ncbi:MAG: orotidine-5'-phosphate decarboxylase [Verrucomicrobiota bacterium]|nr:orotidine-5'-phosphate decarboxylase [Verrucomicrobiota bacterium]
MPLHSPSLTNSAELSFLKRASLTRHPLTQRLFQLMERKQTNLSVALDVTSQTQLLELADALGPQLCVLKTHVDLLEDYTPDFGHKLQMLADKHQFLIFEDRKFADIGQTSSLQYAKGIYRIAEWAHLINAHIVPGPGIIDGLKQIGAPKQRGLLLIAEMSSAGTTAKGAYTRKTVQLAEEHADFVIGFISLRKLSDQPNFLHFTPGVKLKKGKDSLGQRYRTVEEIVGENQSDIIIVGRDITHAVNPQEQAITYRQAAWETLSRRCR